MRPMTARLAALALALAATALGSTEALAARKATHSESRAITAAVKHSRLTSGVPDREYRVSGIRVATVAAGWSTAQLSGKGRYADRVQTVSTVLRRRGGHWRVRAIGGAGLGCHVPRAVARDLRLGRCR
jgi:hypothetical protein